MKYQKDSFIKLSFSIWLDHLILTKGEAFTTGEYPLYYVEDEKLPNGYLSYSSPFKQWVWDSSVNAIIPTQIKSGENYLNIDDENYIVDYDNGRILIKTSDSDLDLSAEFSYKDINVYLTEQSEDDLLIDKKFKENSRNLITEGGITPYNFTSPAIFLNFKESNSTPFELGGVDDVTYYVTATVITDDLFLMDSVCSILRNSKELLVPLIDNINNIGSGACYPFGGYWSTDIGGYNYDSRILQKMYNNELDYCYIKNTNIYSISNSLREELNLSQYVKFVDFELSAIYNPRRI